MKKNNEDFRAENEGAPNVQFVGKEEWKTWGKPKNTQAEVKDGRHAEQVEQTVQAEVQRDGSVAAVVEDPTQPDVTIAEVEDAIMPDNSESLDGNRALNDHLPSPSAVESYITEVKGIEFSGAASVLDSENMLNHAAQPSRTRWGNQSACASVDNYFSKPIWKLSADDVEIDNIEKYRQLMTVCDKLAKAMAFFF